MRIYLARHGQSQDNAHKIVSGDRETPLTELGKRQSRLLGKEAKTLGINLIVCSPLRRAHDTAKIVAAELDYPLSDIVVMDELAERDLGALEGHSYAKNEYLNGNFPAVEHIQGVEPLSHLHSRVHQALREISGTGRDKNVLIICHFIVGRMLKTIAENRPPSAIYEVPRLENATIYPLV